MDYIYILEYEGYIVDVNHLGIMYSNKVYGYIYREREGVDYGILYVIMYNCGVCVI